MAKAKTISKRPLRRAKVKLPDRFANGSRLKRHPLSFGYAEYRVRNPGTTVRSFAPKLGIVPQSFHEMLQAAENDRNYLVPPDHLRTLCLLFSIEPHMFRPDFYDKGMTFKRENHERKSGGARSV